MMQSDGINRKAIFWISVLALFTAAFAFAVRAGISKAMTAQIFEPHDMANAGQLLGTTQSNAFLGFALSLLVISPLLDKIGAKRVILFASFCFIIGPALVLFAASQSEFGSLWTWLNVGMIVWGFGWGATEGSINPLTTTIYSDEKTGKLNSLHAWWPFGMIVGGLLSYFLIDRGVISWQTLVIMSMIPGVLFGLWALRHNFPQTESTAKGISFGAMLVEPFKRISFWTFFAIMLCTAAAELGPGQWVNVVLSKTVGMSGILVLVYVAAIMFVMRHFAGALEHRFSDIGLLCLSSIPAALGLYLLGTANSPVTALVAATIWAIGVCYMWPTMLAAAARRYPDGGAWTIGLMGVSGALAMYFVLPRIGAIYDQALAKATAANVDAGAFAAAQSFQTIAIVPAVLFFLFGAVWLLERGKRS